MHDPQLKCLRCGGPAVRLVQTGELSCARECSEVAVQMARRIVLQEQVSRIASVLGEVLPDGVGFTLVLADFGAPGNMAYASSIEREGCMSLLEELLDKMRIAPTQDAVPRAVTERRKP